MTVQQSSTPRHTHTHTKTIMWSTRSVHSQQYIRTVFLSEASVWSHGRHAWTLSRCGHINNFPLPPSPQLKPIPPASRLLTGKPVFGLMVGMPKHEHVNSSLLPPPPPPPPAPVKPTISSTINGQWQDNNQKKTFLITLQNMDNFKHKLKEGRKCFI